MKFDAFLTARRIFYLTQKKRLLFSFLLLTVETNVQLFDLITKLCIELFTTLYVGTAFYVWIPYNTI